MQYQATIFNKGIVFLLFFIMVLPGIATGQDSLKVSY